MELKIQAPGSLPAVGNSLNIFNETIPYQPDA